MHPAHNRLSRATGLDLKAGQGLSLIGTQDSLIRPGLMSGVEGGMSAVSLRGGRHSK